MQQDQSTATAARPSGSVDDLATELDADIQELRRQLPTLEAVERRRSRLWLVASVLLVAASAMVFVLLLVPDASALLPDNTALRAATGLVSLAFLLYVYDQERRLRRLARDLIDERVLSSLLTERVRDLSSLTRVGQVVNSVLATDDVLAIILRGARELTDAVAGSVMLVDRAASELVVKVSTGEHAAPQGARQPLHTGVAGHVAATREPLLITGEVTPTQVEERRPRRRLGGSSVIAPMIAHDEVIGVLALEREHGAEDFSQWELRPVSLFANHAATAVENAQRYEAEREDVARLADMIERRADVVAMLVHDLKAPLTSILGNSRLLSTRGDTLDAAGGREAVRRIQLGSEDLLSMIDGVLRSASLEPSEPVRPAPVELRPLLDDVVESAQAMAAARDGQPRAIRIRVPHDGTATTNLVALRAILQNLLENAVKYSPPGSPIDLVARGRDGSLELVVTDRGRGIAPEDQELIFERFRRRSPGASTDGVGLGLYVVRSLVQAQGGTIEVDSAPGNGATFRVTLPAPGPDPAAPLPPRSEG